jgi:hypothetical protein
VEELYSLPDHDPAVPLYVDPTPRPNDTIIPIPFVVSQVPVVSPGIVKDIDVHVLADEIVYENGYERVCPLLQIQPPNVPVKELRTQKDNVTVDALAVPHAKSAQFKPSIICLIRK